MTSIVDVIAAIQRRNPGRVVLDGAAFIATFLPDWARVFDLVPPEHLAQQVGAGHLAGRLSRYAAAVVGLCDATQPVAPHPSQPSKVVLRSRLLRVDVAIDDRGIIEAGYDASVEHPAVSVPDDVLAAAAGLRDGMTLWANLRLAATGARALVLAGADAVDVPAAARGAVLAEMRGSIGGFSMKPAYAGAARLAIAAASIEAAVPLRIVQPVPPDVATWFGRYVEQFGTGRSIDALHERKAIAQGHVRYMHRSVVLTLGLLGGHVHPDWPPANHAEPAGLSLLPVVLPVGSRRFVPVFVGRDGEVYLLPGQVTPGVPRPAEPAERDRPRIGLLAIEPGAWPRLATAAQVAELRLTAVLEAINAVVVAAAAERRPLFDVDQGVAGIRVSCGVDDARGVLVVHLASAGEPVPRLRLEATWADEAGGWLVVGASGFPPPPARGRRGRRRAR